MTIACQVPHRIISDVSALDAYLPGGLPEGVEMPVGMFSFKISNLGAAGEATVTIHLPEWITPSTYYKYGSTLDNQTDHWYDFLFDGETGADIEGNVITLHFIDGQRGDSDLERSGGINDPGGPAFGTPAPVTSGDGGGGSCFIGTML